jgi:hypothetical protein
MNTSEEILVHDLVGCSCFPLIRAPPFDISPFMSRWQPSKTSRLALGPRLRRQQQRRKSLKRKRKRRMTHPLSHQPAAVTTLPIPSWDCRRCLPPCPKVTIFALASLHVTRLLLTRRMLSGPCWITNAYAYPCHNCDSHQLELLKELLTPPVNDRYRLGVPVGAGNIAEWKKKEGDEVAAGDSIAEVETDKVCRRPSTTTLVDPC